MCGVACWNLSKVVQMGLLSPYLCLDMLEPPWFFILWEGFFINDYLIDCMQFRGVEMQNFLYVK